MNATAKKTYSTPRLRTIKLETEEVMSTACKNEAAASGTGQVQCGVFSGTPCGLEGS